MKKEIKIYKYNDSKLSNVYHFINLKCHRDNDKPSYISYYDYGKICFISYSQYDLRHRDYKPAYIRFYKNGNIVYEEYCQNDEVHNDYGPSRIKYKNI